ncbi:hypothetical protein JDV02_005407 [Purpureocillium takamizusanense]|uniref:Ankyrin repeat protein n=1 Tax=Purpureocillium takamizusanense TaxID=2060973 RepID=A0A9Q8QIE8_9HYPO|nr:uncharacterized protein JDV02_005407 [Purpureocillium takamizusanense]UNI19207.1 hypothetical protein JDV02_005407 [Purpureocillium takamizusanense]
MMQSSFITYTRTKHQLAPMAPTQNPFLLAADNSPALLPLLRANRSLASAQDDHGYSLVHAAASYNHLDLLYALVRELKVDVNLKDEDDETALFVVETVDAARVLVEELSADLYHRGSEGLTAREKIESEGDFPDVARYLGSLESRDADSDIASVAANAIPDVIRQPPEGLEVTVGTMDRAEDIPSEVDPEFRRRIEELAQRPDFDAPSGQADLRKLVEDAILDQKIGEERNVRPKHG